jgi:ATP-dependent 26S proteasome regulatory subunit
MDSGRGRTVLLNDLQRATGGTVVRIGEFMAALNRQSHPLRIEEAIDEVLRAAWEAADVVLIDDYHLLDGVVDGCGSAYPRRNLMDVHAMALAEHLETCGKKLIYMTYGYGPSAWRSRAACFTLYQFEPADYRFLIDQFCGESGRSLDVEAIHRFAPRLDAQQLERSCRWLCQQTTPVSTDGFIEYLRERQLASNVDLEEVRPVEFEDLCGVDDIIESLEANIVMPFENKELALRFDLKPKRGVLLAGPPGTGKTTIGRALARKLRGKFFLVDGTCISGTDNFYRTIDSIFEEAKENAPAVIFIDDSDVIFESGREHGLYRYLLTKLDGLESISAERICVMLTAMDVGNIPPALLRSGRIELWLQMRLPDAIARLKILERLIQPIRSEFPELDLDEVANAAEGFTGADLKRLAEDGKSIYVFDLVRGVQPAPITACFLRAVAGIRDNKRLYEEAERRGRGGEPSETGGFDHRPRGALGRGVA